jgi:inner membrane protein
MLARLVAELGPWSWLVLGLVLLVLEVVAPGFFLLWIGVAALIVGAATLLVFAAAPFWIWQFQVLAFLVLALAAAYFGSRWMSGRYSVTDQPLLNRRGAQLIGRTATLAEPIVNGRGRIRIGDTLWRVSGPDLPAGSRVRVKAATDTDLELVVEAD